MGVLGGTGGELGTFGRVGKCISFGAVTWLSAGEQPKPKPTKAAANARAPHRRRRS